jgi:hypothetical protein
VITLLEEAFAPTTSTVGFLHAALSKSTDALCQWRKSLHGEQAVRVHNFRESLPEVLRRLSPLTGGSRPRELLVATQNSEWTAYFDCGLTGTDAESAIGYLSQKLGCEGLYVTTIPHTIEGAYEQPGRYGAVKLVIFGPRGASPLGYVRIVSVVHDGRRWVFDEDGDPQPFENLTRYRARRVRDRFDSETLAQYCAKLGLHPFVEDFYVPSATLIEHSAKLPHGAMILPFEEAQKWLGIRPGLATRLPG